MENLKKEIKKICSWIANKVKLIVKFILFISSILTTFGSPIVVFCGVTAIPILGIIKFDGISEPLQFLSLLLLVVELLVLAIIFHKIHIAKEKKKDVDGKASFKEKMLFILIIVGLNILLLIGALLFFSPSFNEFYYNDFRKTALCLFLLFPLFFFGFYFYIITVQFIKIMKMKKVKAIVVDIREEQLMDGPAYLPVLNYHFKGKEYETIGGENLNLSPGNTVEIWVDSKKKDIFYFKSRILELFLSTVFQFLLFGSLLGFILFCFIKSLFFQ